MGKNAVKQAGVAKLFWDRSGSLDLNVRIAALVFAAAAIVSMAFTQLGFWSPAVIDDKPAYLILILGPLVMSAFVFGPLTGCIIGLFTGGVLYIHSMAFPLDFYEVYLLTIPNTFGTFAVVGAAAGFLYMLVLRRAPEGAVRVVLVALVSLVVSALASGLILLNTLIMYGSMDDIGILRELLLVSRRGVIFQVLVDAVFIAVLCIVTDAALTSIAAHGQDRKLLVMFRSWMVHISLVVFMLMSAVIFSAATIQAQMESGRAMRSEVEYVAKQIDVQGEKGYKSVLDGYDVVLDGTIFITDDVGKVLATDNKQRFPVGSDAIAKLGVDDISTDEFFRALGYEGTAVIQAVDEEGNMTMNIDYLAEEACAGGHVLMIRSADEVYASRFRIMLSATLLAVILIVAISLLATRLLNRVVVQRIDETNLSLGKITNGDLNERVKVRDSREFTSLSAGINSTVAALKDSIAEAKQRNAQELLTAKAIQESSLPREFPPFPEIDRFDIYASMKTAKEVGGDFYDFFLIGEDKLGFLMADVSGKGIPAALFMMTAKTQIQTYMEAELSISEAVSAANHQLCIGNDAGMFVTMFACVLDYRTGELSYVNAGHNPPLAYKHGTWSWMRDVSGMPLGLFDGMPYEQFTRQMEPEEMLYLYTDGVTEAMDIEGNLFGEDRLEETLYKYAHMNPRSVGVGVRRAITDFTLDCEQSDDITMLILKYGVPPERKAVMILPALDEQLVHVHNFIHEELRRRSAPKSVYNPLDIAAEELFVNVCHYAYPDATPDDPGEVRIGFEYAATPPSLTVTISDDGIPYNPLAKPDAVTPDDIADVPIGGLGILMAKRSTDMMNYERVDGSNILTFRKEW